VQAERSARRPGMSATRVSGSWDHIIRFADYRGLPQLRPLAANFYTVPELVNIYEIVAW